MKNYKIVVVGTCYVGLSIATLLAQYNEVVAVDIVQEKVYTRDLFRRGWSGNFRREGICDEITEASDSTERSDGSGAFVPVYYWFPKRVFRRAISASLA